MDFADIWGDKTLKRSWLGLPVSVITKNWEYVTLNLGVYEFDWIKLQIEQFMAKTNHPQSDEIDLDSKNCPLIAKSFHVLLGEAGLLDICSSETALMNPEMTIDNGSNMILACKEAGFLASRACVKYCFSFKIGCKLVKQ